MKTLNTIYIRHCRVYGLSKLLLPQSPLFTIITKFTIFRYLHPDFERKVFSFPSTRHPITRAGQKKNYPTLKVKICSSLIFHLSWKTTQRQRCWENVKTQISDSHKQTGDLSRPLYYWLKVMLFSQNLHVKCVEKNKEETVIIVKESNLLLSYCNLFSIFSC